MILMLSVRLAAAAHNYLVAYAPTNNRGAGAALAIKSLQQRSLACSVPRHPIPAWHP